MNEQFGAFIKEMRKKNNLTQKQLAKQLNISNKAVSKWEVGDSCPDISLLLPISIIFDITVDELLNCKLDSKRQKTEITKKLILFNIASNILLVVILIVFLILSRLQTSDSSSIAFAITDLETFTSVILVTTILITVLFGIYNFLQYIKYERGIKDEEISII